jgi:hypothetical protein
VTGPDQGFLVSRLVLTLKPWERGWADNCFATNKNKDFNENLDEDVPKFDEDVP